LASLSAWRYAALPTTRATRLSAWARLTKLPWTNSRAHSGISHAATITRTAISRRIRTRTSPRKLGRWRRRGHPLNEKPATQSIRALPACAPDMTTCNLFAAVQRQPHAPAASNGPAAAACCARVARAVRTRTRDSAAKAERAAWLAARRLPSLLAHRDFRHFGAGRHDRHRLVVAARGDGDV
jgi:hypothetical protein